MQEQMLVRNRENNARRDQDHLHSSEICKPGWCPRASWYALTGVEPERVDKVGRRALNIFEEGHSIHDRYQQALWDAGVLEGMWECTNCMYTWWDVSPKFCIGCESEHLRYREVPVADEELHIVGHGDGIVVLPEERKRRVLIEVKSIGLGTIRIEAPTLYKKIQDKELTLTQAWSEIKRPFPVHLRQGMLYLRALNMRTCVFLYDFKPDQSQKEFVTTYNEDIIADIIFGAKQVKAALTNGTVVRRPLWAEDENTRECKKCPYRSKCWRLQDDQAAQVATDRPKLRLLKP